VIPVLLYHSVAERCDPRFATWSVTPDLFDRHLTHLAAEGYTALTVRDLVARVHDGAAPLPERAVVITFDDGLADFHAQAWPLLRRHGLTATVFVATAFVGGTSEWLAPLGEGRRPMMSWEQIAELSADGIECAAHGHEHLQLDTISVGRAWADIAQSRRALEPVVGEVSSFAYPHGYFTRCVQRLVAQAGFRGACAVRHALSGRDDDRFALARVVVRGETGEAAFGALVKGEGLRVTPPDRALRRAAWRSVRRVRAGRLVERGQEAVGGTLTAVRRT
jgi:peptidoglycan/xylan/chitin deacetylase (PgdA/CDA1 family)